MPTALAMFPQPPGYKVFGGFRLPGGYDPLQLDTRIPLFAFAARFFKMLSLQTTDLPLDRFPEYAESPEAARSPNMTVNGPINKLVQQLQGAEPSRTPSPQPTHFSVPQTNGNGHRVLRSATVGYIAPEFKGKAEQKNQGMSMLSLCPDFPLTHTSQGDSLQGGMDPRAPCRHSNRVVLHLSRYRRCLLPAGKP